MVKWLVLEQKILLLLNNHHLQTTTYSLLTNVHIAYLQPLPYTSTITYSKNL